jgi:hypothetical protein
LIEQPEFRELLYCLALILYALVSLAWTHEPQPAFIIYSHGLLAEGILLTLLVGLLLTKLFLTLLAGATPELWARSVSWAPACLNALASSARSGEDVTDILASRDDEVIFARSWKIAGLVSRKGYKHRAQAF